MKLRKINNRRNFIVEQKIVPCLHCSNYESSKYGQRIKQYKSFWHFFYILQILIDCLKINFSSRKSTHHQRVDWCNFPPLKIIRFLKANNSFQIVLFTSRIINLKFSFERSRSQFEEYIIENVSAVFQKISQVLPLQVKCVIYLKTNLSDTSYVMTLTIRYFINQFYRLIVTVLVQTIHFSFRRSDNTKIDT